MTAVAAPGTSTAEGSPGHSTERLFEATLGTLELATVLARGQARPVRRPPRAGDRAERRRGDRRPPPLRPRVAGAAGDRGPGLRRRRPDPAARRYHLSEAQRLVLLEQDSPSTPAPWRCSAVAAGRSMPTVLEAWREGRGVSFGEYGDDVRVGQALFNRGGFLGPLVSEWLPAVPDVDALLRRDGARRARPRLRRRVVRHRARPGLPRAHGRRRRQRRRVDHGRPAQRGRGGVGDRARFEVRRADGRAPRTPTTWPSSSRASTTWATRSRR